MLTCLKRKKKINKGTRSAECVQGRAVRVEVGKVGSSQIMQHFVDPLRGMVTRPSQGPDYYTHTENMKKATGGG